VPAAAASSRMGNHSTDVNLEPGTMLACVMGRMRILRTDEMVVVTLVLGREPGPDGGVLQGNQLLTHRHGGGPLLDGSDLDSTIWGGGGSFA
jgi:hypothetical protein